MRVKSTGFGDKTSWLPILALPLNSLSSCASVSPFVKCWDYYKHLPLRGVRIIRVSTYKITGTLPGNTVMFNKAKSLLFLDHRIRSQGLRKLRLSAPKGARP